MTQLDMETWHTSRREDTTDYEQSATPPMWGRIVESIVKYQNKWHGSSPTNLQISHDIRIPVGKVNYHMKALIEKGLVEELASFPRQLRVAMVKPSKMPLPATGKLNGNMTIKEAKVVSNKNGWGGFFSEGGFMRAARDIADATLRYYADHGHAPGNKEVSKMLGYKSGTTVSMVVTEMVKRGWFFHKKHGQHDFAVTGLGRDVLDLNRTTPTPAPETVPEAPPEMPKTFMRMPATVEVGQLSEPTRPQPANANTDTWPLDLMKADSVDLLLELQSRGFKVTR